MTTAVRAPKTFRRLAASETLNDSGQAAIKPEPKKADIPQRPARIILGCGSGLDPRKQRAGSLPRARPSLFSSEFAGAPNSRGRIVTPSVRDAGRECERVVGIEPVRDRRAGRSDEHTSELQSLMSISYAI